MHYYGYVRVFISGTEKEQDPSVESFCTKLVFEGKYGRSLKIGKDGCWYSITASGPEDILKDLVNECEDLKNKMLVVEMKLRSRGDRGTRFIESFAAIN
jgi:hypothetical protein